MTDYICEFNDGSYSPIEVATTYGKREMVGTATRGDGLKRVVFFADGERFDPLALPHRLDPWVHRIRRRTQLTAVRA